MPRSRPRRRVGAFEIAACGLLAAAALVFGYVEALFPLPVPVPGVKLGLGNVAVLCALVTFGPRQAFLVMLVKVGVSALLFGNPAVLAYSAAGALASFAAMACALRVRALSVTGVSMVGGVCHMLGQLAVVAAVFSPAVALTYLPVLLVAGLASGAVCGAVCHLMVRAFGRSAAFARWHRAREKERGARSAAAPRPEEDLR